MKILCKNKHWKLNEDYNIDKILYLLIDRPTYIDAWNDFAWENKKEQYHRNYDLPAYVFNDGHIEWWKKSKFHRNNNKPAIIKCDGLKKYYINDNLIKLEN